MALVLLVLGFLLRWKIVSPAQLIISEPAQGSHHYQFGDESESSSKGIRVTVKLLPNDVTASEVLSHRQNVLAPLLKGDHVNVCTLLTWQGTEVGEHYKCTEASSKALNHYQSSRQDAAIDISLTIPWRIFDSGGTSRRFNLQVHMISGSVKLYSKSPIIFSYHGIIKTKDVLESPAYVISLAKRNPTRWETTRTRLAGAGFKNVIRFPAVDGSEFSGYTQLEKKYSIMWGSLGHRACSASHTSLWAFLLDCRKNDKVFTIFEDDALPHENFGSLLGKFLSSVPSEAEIVYLGWQRGAIQIDGRVFLDPPTEASMPLALRRHPACLHAYIVTPAVLDKLLRNVLPLHDTVDGKVMRLSWKGIIKSYAFNGMRNVSSMLTTNLSPEDIQSNAEYSFDGDVNSQIANDVKAGENCPSGMCPHMVVLRVDRSRGIVHQDATMGTDIDAHHFESDTAPSLSRYAKK